MCNGCIISFFCFEQMTVLSGLIYVDPLNGSSFSWMLRISKYFKHPTFLAPQFYDRVTWVVEIERNLFLGKCIITLLSIMHIKLNAVVHTKCHHFSLLLSKPSAFHSLLTTVPSSTPPWLVNLTRSPMSLVMSLHLVPRVLML
jgi:hypothetical protein